MTPPASLTATPPEAYPGNDEFELDMRVIQAITPLAAMTCDTSDTCGETCNTTACNSSSNDPY